MYKKLAIFGDLHLGKKQSEQFNQDCLNFVRWFCEESANQNCDTCVFLGDFHDNRKHLNISTMNFSMKCLEMLSQTFQKVYLILGNHDLYLRNKRDIHSIEIAKTINNIIIIDQPTIIDDLYLVPWLIDEEWKVVSKQKSKYCFGHFELPSFILNGNIEMPNKHNINLDNFKRNHTYIFSGHFHKRQIKDNIHYIGNCFPHDYGDAWDDQRGFCVLENNNSPVYINYPNCPKYINIELNDLVNHLEVIDSKCYVKISAENLNWDDAAFIKQILDKHFQPRDLKIQSFRRIEEAEEVEFENKTIDDIIMESLESMKQSKSEVFDYDLLIELYGDLKT